MAGDLEALWRHVAGQFRCDIYSTHGMAHWRRVERNGLLLTTRTGADGNVVRLFALFHDACRIDDAEDPEHGTRGAALATDLRSKGLFTLNDDAFDLLQEACRGHTQGHLHNDPTVGTCWDADRLDLGRIGVIPDPHFMSTAFGREISRCGSIQPFLVPEEAAKPFIAVP